MFDANANRIQFNSTQFNGKYLHWLVHRQSRMVCLLGCRTRLSNRVCQILRFPPVCAHQFLVLSPSCSPATTGHETTISRKYVTKGWLAYNATETESER